MKISSMILSLVLNASAAAQTSGPLIHDFDAIVKKVETNYAGYYDKVTPKTRAAYEAITKETRAKLAKAGHDEALPIMNEWVQFVIYRHP